MREIEWQGTRREREKKKPGGNNKIYYLSLNIIFLPFQKIKKTLERFVKINI